MIEAFSLKMRRNMTSTCVRSFARRRRTSRKRNTIGGEITPIGRIIQTMIRWVSTTKRAALTLAIDVEKAALLRT
jgi:hypothetical protein